MFSFNNFLLAGIPLQNSIVTVASEEDFWQSIGRVHQQEKTGARSLLANRPPTFCHRSRKPRKVSRIRQIRKMIKHRLDIKVNFSC